MTKLRFGTTYVEIVRNGGKVQARFTDDGDVSNPVYLELEPTEVHELCRALVTCAWSIVMDKIGPLMTWVKALGVEDE